MKSEPHFIKLEKKSSNRGGGAEHRQYGNLIVKTPGRGAAETEGGEEKERD